MSEENFDNMSTDTPAGEQSVGQVLRAAREARGESLADVAYALRLAQRQVEAMELERFDELPGPAFVRGFLRNYAKYLGINIDSLLAQLGGPASVPVAPVVIEATGKHAIGTLPVGDSRRRVPRLGMLVLAAAIAVGVAAYFDWFQVNDSARPAEPAVQAPLISPAAGIDMAASQTDSTSAAGGDESTPVASDVLPAQTGSDNTQTSTTVLPAPVVEASPVAVPPSTVTAEAAAPAVSDPAESTEPAAVSEAAPARAAVEAEQPVAPADGEQLVFVLNAESWIQVRDASGNTIYMGTGAAGTTRVVQGKAPFSIVVGNADKVSLEYQGKPVDMKPHTGSGGVARMKVE